MRVDIIGAGGHGKVAAEIAELSGFTDIRFYDDRADTMDNVGPWPVAGRPKDRDPAIPVHVAIGNCAARFQIARDLGDALISLIHPAATVSRYADIAPGCLIAAAAVVAPFARVDMAVIVNTAASVDHDCRIGPAVHICPGARIAGEVTIGARSWVGIGAAVRQRVEIGQDVIVGAGGVVTGNIGAPGTYIGVPARLVSVAPTKLAQGA